MLRFLMSLSENPASFMASEAERVGCFFMHATAFSTKSESAEAFRGMSGALFWGVETDLNKNVKRYLNKSYVRRTFLR